MIKCIEYCILPIKKKKRKSIYVLKHNICKIKYHAKILWVMYEILTHSRKEVLYRNTTQYDKVSIQKKSVDMLNTN